MTRDPKHFILEDPVDMYTRTWAVLLLLVLSLLSILLPLAQSGSGTTLFFTTDDQNRRENLPQSERNHTRYTAACWTPPQFTPGLISYTQSICSAAFSRAMSGGSYRKSFLDASIYQPREVNQLPPIDNSSEEDLVLLNTPSGSDADSEVEKKSTNVELETDDRSRNPAYYATSLVAFIFAIAIELSHIIWVLCSPTLASGIAHTVLSLVGSQLTDKDTRQRIARDVVSALANHSSGPLFTNSLLYLLLKVLICILAVSAVVILLVTGDIGNFNEEKLTKPDVFNNVSEMSKISTSDYINTPLICEFSVQNLQNLQHYSILCLFSPENPISSQEATVARSYPMFDSTSTLDISSVLSHMVVALFSIVAVVNFFSFLVWVFRLSCFKKNDFSSQNLTTDVYFLLYMARLQAGHLLARDLEDAFYDHDNPAEEEPQIVSQNTPVTVETFDSE